MSLVVKKLINCMREATHPEQLLYNSKFRLLLVERTVYVAPIC